MFEIIRLEAPPSDRLCTLCASAPGTYRCKDCFANNFYCATCCLSAHSMRPFHRIQKFVQGFFEASDLDNLGFKLDIRPHTHDCSPQSSRPAGSYSDIYPISDDDGDDWEDDDETTINDSYGSEFRRLASDVGKTVIVASTGVFKRSLQWCTCPNAPKKHIQLLRARLFPATFINPKSAFTFEVLDHFRLDALECRTSAMNFMSKLSRRTNEIFPGTVPVRIYSLTCYSSRLMYRPG